MAKLRTLLTTALLALPIMSLSAAQAGVDGNLPGTRVETSSSLTGCCLVFVNGKWYCYPCD
jgi:hypothetical protein